MTILAKESGGNVNIIQGRKVIASLGLVFLVALETTVQCDFMVDFIRLGGKVTVTTDGFNLVGIPLSADMTVAAIPLADIDPAIYSALLVVTEVGQGAPFFQHALASSKSHLAVVRSLRSPSFRQPLTWLVAVRSG